jgi:hypothetical protein
MGSTAFLVRTRYSNWFFFPPATSFYPSTSFLLFVIFLASILLKVETVYTESDLQGAGYNKTLILVLLFGSTISVLLLGIKFLMKDVAESRKTNVVMCDDKGTPIQFMKLQTDEFHLFLSHTWATGQVRM